MRLYGESVVPPYEHRRDAENAEEAQRRVTPMNRATLILFALIVFATPFVVARSLAKQQPPPQPKLEGCVSCHGLIEPMHKYVTTETLD